MLQVRLEHLGNFPHPLLLHPLIQPQLVLLQCRFQLVEFHPGVSSGGCARLLPYLHLGSMLS
jgi:hypothetical protein